MPSTNKIPFKKFIPGIACFILIFILVTFPGNDIPKISFLDEISFDKLVHIGMFGILAILFCWPFYKSQVPSEKRIRYFIIIALLTSAWGYGAELIQKFWVSICRSYDLYDWSV